MRTSIRIVAGTLRGRKINCTVTEDLRPTPQMVREALFSILGNAIPNRTFVDVFSGTGVMGLEALSRGASSAIFVERDASLAKEIEGHLRSLNLLRQSRMFRTDAYRWVAAWRAPKEPVNVFFSPPFADLSNDTKSGDLRTAIETLQAKVAEDSLIIVQSERGAAIDEMPPFRDWEVRRYGRNELLIWQREITSVQESPTEHEDGVVHPSEST